MENRKFEEFNGRVLMPLVYVSACHDQIHCIHEQEKIYLSWFLIKISKFIYTISIRVVMAARWFCYSIFMEPAIINILSVEALLGNSTRPKF